MTTITPYMMRNEMMRIHRAMILSPLLFVLGCAVTGDDAQESTSQKDVLANCSGSPGSMPMARPTMPPYLAVAMCQPPPPNVTCTWNTNTTSVSFDPRGILYPITPDVVAALFWVGGLSFHAGGSLQCDWSTGLHTKLTLQGNDGNFVFYNQTNGRTWGAHTRRADNPNGPGVTAEFQSDANLVVRNAAGNAIWASNTHTFPQALLAFQSDGNLVIYNHFDTAQGPVYQPLWATGTE
jgi:hypothetical protein